MKRAVITGIGIYSCIGKKADEVTESLRSGRSGIGIDSVRTEYGYRSPLTGDMARFHTEPCSCGRNTMRISPLIGRKNHVIKYKGTTLYPPAIFDVLDNASYVDLYCVDVADNEIGTDSVTVRIGLRPSCTLPHEAIIKELKDQFRARLRVAPEISIDDADLLRRTIYRESGRKPVKFFDFRKKNIQTT